MGSVDRIEKSREKRKECLGFYMHGLRRGMVATWVLRITHGMGHLGVYQCIFVFDPFLIFV